MNVGHQLAKAVKALTLSPVSMASHRATCLAAGWKEADAGDRLHKEWLNDMISLGGNRRASEAAADPNARFSAWLDARLETPYHVSHRTHATVCAKHGDGACLLFSEVRWSQEVAWARRMRESDDDRIVVLAETWLGAARRDPSTVFKGIVDLYVADGVEDDGYRDSSLHMSSEADIAAMEPDPPGWRPLWLRFAEREFGRLMGGMPQSKIAAVAAHVRQSARRKAISAERGEVVARLRRTRVALMMSVLSESAKRGMTSDQLLGAERAFLSDVEGGVVDPSADGLPPWRTFLSGIDRWDMGEPDADADEWERRTEAMRDLAPAWTDGLPDWFGRVGGCEHARLLAWYAERTQSGRIPPGDPAIDYGMWLLAKLDGDASLGLASVGER